MAKEILTEAELERLKDIENWINEMLSDGCDCPFCDFQQLQDDGHRNFCPMNPVTEAQRPTQEAHNDTGR